MKPYDQITIRLQTPGMPVRQGETNESNDLGSKKIDLNWSELLALARSRPGMYIGASSKAHLEALRSTIDFVSIARPFRLSCSVHILCSPTQYVVRCIAGSLSRLVERSVDWNTDRMLVDLLGDPYFHRTQGTYTLCGTHPVALAERFFGGITSKSGFRHQTYRNGWPTTDVQLMKEKSPYSFVVAGQLTTEWFTGLPFTLATVEAVIAEYPSVRVTCDMRSSDDILPENAQSMAELCLDKSSSESDRTTF